MPVDYDPLRDPEMLDARPVYAELRAHDPVHHLEQYGAWALASFDAVWQACSDTTSFSVRRGQTPYQVLLGEPAMNLTFPELDPPEHRHRRRVLAPFYTREAAEVDAPVVREIACDVLTPLLERGEFDVFVDYASPVTARVAARKAGIPEEHSGSISALLHDAVARVPGQRGTSEANAAAMSAAFGEIHEAIGAARADRTLARGTLAQLLDARVDGSPLDDAQIAAELHTLLVTGSETVELAVASAVVNLHREPGQRAELLANPGLAGLAFAEAIRIDHPTDTLCRVVARDVGVGGRMLREGDGVLLLWGSANRDDAVFDRPERFAMHRRSDRSLIFGHGQHKCVGEHLAMKMGAAILGELYASISAITVDESGLSRRRGEILKGFCTVPVSIVPR